MMTPDKEVLVTPPCDIEIPPHVTNCMHLLLFMIQSYQRMFDPDPTTFTSLYDYESYEKLLYKTLDRVTQRKEYMLSNQTPAYHPRALQVTPNIRILTFASIVIQI
ncbi:hypothetical protein Hanom_Chr03g00275231 [Helianthus anomalus]